LTPTDLTDSASPITASRSAPATQPQETTIRGLKEHSYSALRYLSHLNIRIQDAHIWPVSLYLGDYQHRKISASATPTLQTYINMSVCTDVLFNMRKHFQTLRAYESIPTPTIPSYHSRGHANISIITSVCSNLEGSIIPWTGVLVPRSLYHHSRRHLHHYHSSVRDIIIPWREPQYRIISSVLSQSCWCW